VLIVGEIYVRRDDFAVGELIRHLSRRGIIVKVSGIAEWVYYCDYVRYHEIKKTVFTSLVSPIFCSRVYGFDQMEY